MVKLQMVYMMNIIMNLVENIKESTKGLYMKKQQFCLLIILILILSFGINGCGKNDVTTNTENETSKEETVIEQTNPLMELYEEVASENIVLQAQEKHLDSAIQYYESIKMSQSADMFEQKSFAEEVMGSNTTDGSEEGVLMDYPDFNPDAVEIIIPDISEEDIETRTAELEIQNEELKEKITNMQEYLTIIK